jgi:hypothetical protein
LIHKTLHLLQENDFLLYSDAGACFIQAIDPLVQTCEQFKQDIMPFDVGLVEKAFTKRDAFILMNCDTSAYTDTIQRQASFILFKKSKVTTEFVREYLEYAQDVRIITDLDNQMGKPNYPEFQAHRHDQSIFSLLTKRNHLVGHRDPSQWGNGGETAYAQYSYGQLIQHTRARNVSPCLTSIHIMQRMMRYLRSRSEAEYSRRI